MRSDLDETQLLEAIRKGGRGRDEAISTLYRQLFPQLMAHLRMQGCPHHKAEDCVQETFIKALRKVEEFRGESKLSTWIRTILDHTWRDHRRSVFEARGVDLESGGVEHMEGDESWNPPQQLYREELKDCVQRGYKEFQLKHPQCAGWVYRWIDGASISELSQESGRTPGAMREFLSQCRKKLAPFIEHCRHLLQP